MSAKPHPQTLNKNTEERFLKLVKENKELKARNEELLKDNKGLFKLLEEKSKEFEKIDKEKDDKYFSYLMFCLDYLNEDQEFKKSFNTVLEKIRAVQKQKKL